ncbi:MAG: flp pilus-assembly TadE/G-like family protein [Buchananella hordeovulneris]|nr:flp pilus-assembly TadE/G-like family protein [Buchananella hordeovulneris]
MVAALALLLGVWVVGLGQGALTLASARAATAADLAAVAAATALHSGGGEPCALAATVATKNGTALSSCQVMGVDVLLTVTAAPAAPFALLGEVAARARAGPVER